MTEALLISLGQFEDSSIPALSATTHDVEALQELLRRPDIGASRSDDVIVLSNPTLKQLRETIETFCTLRDPEETALIYFSGHAIVNDQGQLLFPCRDTIRANLELTAYSIAELKAELEACRSNQEVVILDCCFTGTFAKGMISAQDFQTIAQDFSSTRRALLTSPTSIDYSTEHKSKRHSTYTQFLLDALETGMADGGANQPLDGTVNVSELHSYIDKHLEYTNPALSPTIHSEGDGYTMVIVHAPYLEFRRQAVSLASQGEISIVGHNILQARQAKEGIPAAVASAIREDAMLPHRLMQEKQRQFDRIQEEVRQRESPLSDNTQAELLQLRQEFELPTNPFATAPFPNATFVAEPAVTRPAIEEPVAIPVEATVESDTPLESSGGNRLTQFLRERRLLRSPDEEVQPATDPTSRFLQERNISPELVRLGLASLAVLGLFTAVLWALFQPFPGSRPQIASAEGWFNEGTQRAQAGNSNAAIEAYTNALNLSPTPANRAANLYYNRGIEYANNGNIDAAIADYNEAIRLDPALADAYFNRANLAARRGDRSAALKDYQIAERLYQQQNNSQARQEAANAIRALQQ
jgi:tetratricopeptide (TPR) repeat protein